MACMCGDTHCWSCGPAQGNIRCPLCRAWFDDGCEHIGEDGNVLPQFEAEVQRREEEERAADEAYATDLKWMRDHAEDIAEAIRKKE